jgi:hypothetical protein
MVLVMTGVAPNSPPSISFGEGITVTAGAMTPVTYAIPGNSYPSTNYAMEITLSVSPAATLGLRGCYATNPGQPQSEPMPALLNVTPTGG